MSEKEEDRGEGTDHRLGTDNPTIHVHGGEATVKVDNDGDSTTHVHGDKATMKADNDDEDGLDAFDDEEATIE
ncbi:hypothetical protein F52700_11966 [Fusarium sp. NRRL 52700]|nr:hypothetical protein F52700_11966 [Fusarium sp. NRRL 52700]